MRIKTIIAVNLALFSMGCASSMQYPTTGSVQGSNATQISIEGAPPSTSVYVDGKLVGVTDEKVKSPDIYNVSSGKHAISLVKNYNELYNNLVFVADGSIAKIMVK